MSTISTSACTFIEASHVPTMSTVLSSHDNNVQVRWLKSSHPFVKINVDESWIADTSASFLRVVIRDSSGNFIVAWRSRFKAYCVTIAEALAIRCGFELGLSLGLNHVVVESDSKDSICCLRGKISNGIWEAFPTLARCKNIGEAFQDFRWSWIPRSTNMAANLLALRKSVEMCDFSWVD
ncbi:hypothetical protein ACFX2H_043608 [Malus domestica]